MRNVNTGGVMLIIIGLVLLAANLNWLSWYMIVRLWPLILVAAGISMLFRRDGH